MHRTVLPPGPGPNFSPACTGALFFLTTVSSYLCSLSRRCAAGTVSQLGHNCCHFSNELCHELGVGEIPKWVNRAAGAGSAIASGVESLISLKDLDLIQISCILISLQVTWDSIRTIQTTILMAMVYRGL